MALFGAKEVAMLKETLDTAGVPEEDKMVLHSTPGYISLGGGPSTSFLGRPLSYWTDIQSILYKHGVAEPETLDAVLHKNRSAITAEVLKQLEEINK